MDPYAAAERIRAFNRYYMSVLSLLDNCYLGTEFSPVEARVLYEIRSAGCCSAKDISRKIRIDKGYLSRIVGRFEKKGLVTQAIAPEDARKRLLSLTEAGNALTEKLIGMSNEQVISVIDGLSEDECRELCDAMDTVCRILERGAENADH